jgi:hypothetical protein
MWDGIGNEVNELSNRFAVKSDCFEAGLEAAEG